MTVATSRPIPGFPGYEATSDGRIFSTRPWRGSTERRELAGGVGRRGYRSVVLCDGSHRRASEVHVVIATTFLGPCPKGMEVRHLDGDKLNNAVANLRYGTRSENNLDAVRHGTHYNARKTHCPQRHPYDAMNTYISPSGDRGCRACRRAQHERRIFAAANARIS